MGDGGCHPSSCAGPQCRSDRRLHRYQDLSARPKRRRNRKQRHAWRSLPPARVYRSRTSHEQKPAHGAAAVHCAYERLLVTDKERTVMDWRTGMHSQMRRQRGAALVVSAIMLVLLTLFALAVI